MSRLRREIHHAFRKLADREGFQRRPGQEQAALLISDAIEGAARVMIEAPTGSGKSLAALIPALALVRDGGRVVIATFTNVLAEQYWRKDLPLALSLFDWGESGPPAAAYLVGRTRYACRVELESRADEPVVQRFLESAENGADSEFFTVAQTRAERRLWRHLAVPPACAGRRCRLFRECFFYRARSAAKNARIVITNHSLFLNDLLLRSMGSGDLLGAYQFAILDEAHDFPQAAAAALQFSLDRETLRQALEVVERAFEEPSLQRGALRGLIPWARKTFRNRIREAENAFSQLEQSAAPGIVALSPPELLYDREVARAYLEDAPPWQPLVDQAVEALEGLLKALEKMKKVPPGSEDGEDDVFGMLAGYAADLLNQCRSLREPDPVSLTYLETEPKVSLVREVIDVGERLRVLLEGGPPCALLSATLTIDGSFRFFEQESGITPQFKEALPAVFDFGRNAALYVPPLDSIPDPATSRDADAAPLYYRAVANEVERILKEMGGRTLVLFHSRKEMEAVYQIVRERTDLPILIQDVADARDVGDRFRRDVPTSLFAVRSFWTGFDAPGETLSCVVLVRIPFEIPVEPSQLVRQAWLRSRGLDPFADYSLPVAKLMVRQGAGRLLRSESDRGVICLLDPRVRTRAYGGGLVENLPPMRQFDRIEEAVAHVGLGSPRAPLD
jgi:ATP-dependent DNA helicase DinG